MKKLIVMALAVVTLSGCAGEVIPADSSLVKDMSNHDVYMCGVGLKVPGFGAAKIQDDNGVCYQEARKRLANHQITQDEAQALHEEYVARVPQEALKDQQSAERAAIQARREATESSMSDSLVALAECNNNPVICRAHIVNSDLNQAGL